MFESFYGLTANPFRMSADAKFCYAHRGYKKAWSYLKYALEQGEGFVLITGRPGTGKTTLVLDILSDFDQAQVMPVSLVTNQLHGEELLRLVALEFGFPAQNFNKATLLTRIHRHALELYEEGRRVVVIVDEAQNLSVHGLEELRLLSNQQAGNQSLFQIVLIGQEEIRSRIYGQGLDNLQQRIVGSSRLLPLEVDQVQGYVEHRLGIVGWHGDPDLDPKIYALIHRITQGVPMEINLVMARLLLYGALEKKRALDKSDLLLVLNEFDQEKRFSVDQTAMVAEMSQNADEVIMDGEPAMNALAPNSEEDDDSTDDLTHGEEQDADLALAEERTKANREAALENAASTDSGFTPLLTVDKAEAWEGEPFSTPISSATDGDEWVDLAASRDPQIDELSSFHMAFDDEREGHRGLHTDVDELLGGDDRVFEEGRGAWRWFFYPLVFGFLLVALLVPKPGDLITLWYSIRHQVKSTDTAQPVEQRTEVRKVQKIARETPLQEMTPEPQQIAASSQQNAPPPQRTAPLPQTPEPEPEPEQRADQTQSLAIETDRVYPLVFDESDGMLNPQSKKQVAMLATWMQAHPSAMVVITGIAATGEEPLEQMRTALRRAEQIHLRLVNEGVSLNRIVVEGDYADDLPAEAGAFFKLKPMPADVSSRIVES